MLVFVKHIPQLLDVEQLGTVEDFIAIPGKGIKCTVTKLRHLFDLSSGIYNDVVI